MEISMFNNCIKLSVASLYVWVLMFLSSYSYAQSDTFTITEDTVVDSESNPYEEADITVDGATIYLIGDYSFGNMELVNGASIEIPHDYQGSEPYINIKSRFLPKFGFSRGCFWGQLSSYTTRYASYSRRDRFPCA